MLGNIQEKLHCKRLQEHKQKKGLDLDQFGFRKGKWSEIAVNQAL